MAVFSDAEFIDTTDYFSDSIYNSQLETTDVASDIDTLTDNDDNDSVLSEPSSSESASDESSESLSASGSENS